MNKSVRAIRSIPSSCLMSSMRNRCSTSGKVADEHMQLKRYLFDFLQHAMAMYAVAITPVIHLLSDENI